MSRVIKFKAKDSDAPHTWRFSDFDESSFFYGLSDGQIIRDTLCQFTGLKDENGTEIYEGDILEFDAKEWGNDRTNKHPVEWSMNGWQCMGVPSEWGQYCKVIGNIHDPRVTP